MERQTTIFDEAAIAKRAREAKSHLRRVRSTLVAEAKLRPALKRVLAVLWEFTGANEFCWPKQETLAERCGYGPKSTNALQRKLYELRDLGIIAIENGVWGGWRGSSKYLIVWEELAKFCDEPPELPTLEVEPPEHARVIPPNGGDCYPQAGVSDTPKRGYLSTSKNYQRTATEPSDDWNAAAAALGDFGLERVRDAVRVAQTLDLSVDRVLELVEVAKSAGMTSKGWKISPGILFDRLKNDTPGRNPETGWHPDAQAALELVRKRAAEVSNADRSAAETRSATERAAADRERRRTLEARYGPILDGMTADAFRDLCYAAKLNEFQMRAAMKNRRAPLSLFELAKHLQAMERVTE